MLENEELNEIISIVKSSGIPEEMQENIIMSARDLTVEEAHKLIKLMTTES